LLRVVYSRRGELVVRKYQKKLTQADLRALGAVIRGGVKGAMQNDRGFQDANGRGMEKHLKSEKRLGR
jgi:hypothetical protein